jgi:hypothetical protein
MAWLCCKACNWSQDEFWSEDYTPLDELARDYSREILMRSETAVVEKWIAEELGQSYEMKGDLCHVSWKDYMVSVLQEAENKVKNMRFRTEAEYHAYKAVNGTKCPVCGAVDALVVEPY